MTCSCIYVGFIVRDWAYKFVAVLIAFRGSGRIVQMLEDIRASPLTFIPALIDC